MVMFIRESGLMIKLTDMAPTLILTALSTKANGLKTNNTAWGLKRGPMLPAMRANMSKVRNTEKVTSYGLIRANSTENLFKTIFKAKVLISGLTAALLLECGKTI